MILVVIVKKMDVICMVCLGSMDTGMLEGASLITAIASSVFLLRVPKLTPIARGRATLRRFRPKFRDFSSI